MLVQLDKPERAGTIDANPTGEIREARAAQSIVSMSDVEPLALAEPIVEGFPRSSPVLDRVGLSIADHLGEGRQSRHCRLLVRCCDGAGHFGILDDRMDLPSVCRLVVERIEPPDHRPVLLSHHNRHRPNFTQRRDSQPA